ncbi:MAG: FMN-binding protein [Flavobacteriales bacterium]|nr:FMN-binding protein [Flavobacteriia bacterium]NCP05018.1 FMN-binding protein [Flavobacteriales bacterium]PIV94228.1 MAG: FMN-binding protein [Flavobacteriaceae bacterium CG17_big_fil_post_rev_8_21_14_2_50_33_15]PIY10727.1 MAG: FMN-binding protein [Flavobacteriaceae bacterium CG_4_10_14_3_um_filter_33_47]PJB19403.1 MAG: FMN-binding protein [Flavobacteriaceae bacterium CG_4_9_14_3_um_filter_33_16]
MRFKHIILILVGFSFLAFGLPKNIEKKVNKEITETFSVVNFNLISVSIPIEIEQTLASRFGEDNLFKIESDNKFLAYVYISQAASKTALFDYMVLLDSDLIIIKTKVLFYREEYGGEIGSKRWLKQFIGKTQTDDLKYGDNIIAISGATISVRSFTEAINNLLKSLKILHSKNIL